MAFNNKKEWVTVLGGYSRCRHCERKWNCLAGCGGFDDRNYQHFLKDGYVVKVLGERKTVFGTAWYQLNHSSVKKNVRRFHVATWFGVCSYRKLKVTVEKRKDVCPLCKHELVRLRYFGNACLRAIQSRDFWADYEEDGRVVWFEKVKRKWGSGSYEE